MGGCKVCMCVQSMTGPNVTETKTVFPCALREEPFSQLGGVGWGERSPASLVSRWKVLGTFT